MSDEERQLVEEINELRTNPKKYADKVNKYIPYFDGKVLNIPGRKNGILTQEGDKAFKECVSYLQKQKAVDALDPSKGLLRLAQDYIKKIQKKNADTDSIDVDKMLSKYGNFYGDFNTAVEYGGQNPEQAVVNLIVGDGDPTRDHRKSLLNTSFKLVGVAFGTHQVFHNCSVIFTCSEFENSHDKEDIGFLDDGSPKKKSLAKPQPKEQLKSQSTQKRQIQPKFQNEQKEQNQSRRYQPKFQSEQKNLNQIRRYQPNFQKEQNEQKEQNQTRRYQPRIQSDQKEQNQIRRYQPIIKNDQKEQNQTRRYQPIIKNDQKEQNQTRRYQPRLQKEQNEQKEQTQTRRYQPKFQKEQNGQNGQKEKKEETPTRRYQPRFQKEQNGQKEQKGQTPTRRYQPRFQKEQNEQKEQKEQNQIRRYQPKYQKEQKQQNQTRYQPSQILQPKSKGSTRLIRPTWKKKEDDFINDGNDEKKDVISEKRTEKIAIEGGKKIKTITIVRVLADGTKESETQTEVEG